MMLLHQLYKVLCINLKYLLDTISIIRTLCFVYTDTSTGVVFVRPEDEESNKQPRKAWDQAAPVGNLFGDRTFEGTVTRSVSRESEDDALSTGAPLIPVISEVSMRRIMYVDIKSTTDFSCEVSQSVYLYFKHQSFISTLHTLSVYYGK